MDRVLRNKILVVGTGVLDFVRGIFESCEVDFPQKLVDDELKKSGGSHSGIRIPWKITTKYYVASVDFWLDEMPSANQEVIKGYADPDSGVGRVVDAFVYVFHKNNLDSFDGIKAWLPFLDEYEPSIRLCAGLPHKQDTKDPQQLDDLEEWCLDHQFEFVDLDEKTVEPLDKAGWDLAVDILQTNLWDGMKEHKAATKDEEQAADDELLRELQMLNLENGRDQDEIDMPSQSEISEMQKILFGGIDQEDGLDKAFETMQGLREQGKDLSDEERRKLAAKVALSFAAQLGV